ARRIRVGRSSRSHECIAITSTFPIAVTRLHARSRPRAREGKRLDSSCRMAQDPSRPQARRFILLKGKEVVMRKAAIGALSLSLVMTVGGVLLGARAAAAQPAPSGTLTVVVPNFNRENFDRGVTSTVDMPYNGNHQDALIGTARNGDLTPERGL